LNSHLYVVICRDSSGRLVGLAPFFWRQHRTAGVLHARELAFLGTGINIYTSDYLDIICRKGYEKDVVASISQLLLRNDDWDRLWLTRIRANSVTLPLLQSAFGSTMISTECSKAYSTDVAQDWEIFKKSLSKSARFNLGYYTRRFYKLHDCSFSLSETREEVESSMTALVKLHQKWWTSKGYPGSFSLPSFEVFIREVVHTALRDGQLKLWTLKADGEIVSVLLGFEDNGIMHYFQKGMDPAYLKDSLGTVMLNLCMKDCFDEKRINIFDFMSGDDEYKLKYTTHITPTMELCFTRPGIRSVIYKTCRKIDQTGRSLVRATVPHSVRQSSRKLLRGFTGNGNQTNGEEK
jgi:hypothetical protein